MKEDMLEAIVEIACLRFWPAECVSLQAAHFKKRQHSNQTSAQQDKAAQEQLADTDNHQVQNTCIQRFSHTIVYTEATLYFSVIYQNRLNTRTKVFLQHANSEKLDVGEKFKDVNIQHIINTSFCTPPSETNHQKHT